MLTRKNRYLPAIIWALLILTLSALPKSNVPKIELPYIDKVVHFCMYFGLSWLLCLGYFIKYNNNLKFIILFTIMLLSSVFGIKMELIQFKLNIGRSMEFNDIVANSFGAFFGVLIFNQTRNIANKLIK